MSHWTKSNVEIKDLAKVAKAAQALGCKVEQGDLKFKSRWAGTVDAQMIITGPQGGQCAIVKSEDGQSFQTIIDSYHNPIAGIVGNNCETLCRDYTSEVVRSQAMMMGGVVTSDKVLQDGSVELRISL